MKEEETTSARQQGGEMVREVCDKMLDPASTCKACDFVQCPMLVKFAADIRAAHEREMAAVVAERDAEILRRATLEREMAEKAAEIARLKSALKPVMECNEEACRSFGDHYLMLDNAVREAQRVMLEGGEK